RAAAEPAEGGVGGEGWGYGSVREDCGRAMYVMYAWRSARWTGRGSRGGASVGGEREDQNTTRRPAAVSPYPLPVPPGITRLGHVTFARLHQETRFQVRARGAGVGFDAVVGGVIPDDHHRVRRTKLRGQPAGATRRQRSTAHREVANSASEDCHRGRAARGPRVPHPAWTLPAARFMSHLVPR